MLEYRIPLLKKKDFLIDILLYAEIAAAISKFFILGIVVEKKYYCKIVEIKIVNYICKQLC